MSSEIVKEGRYDLDFLDLDRVTFGTGGGGGGATTTGSMTSPSYTNFLTVTCWGIISGRGSSASPRLPRVSSRRD